MAPGCDARWSEQETRSRLINPALEAAGWNFHHQVREDFPLTAGRVIIRGPVHTRGRSKRADYVLYLKPNIPLAVVEAKDAQQTHGIGMQQALEYARMLDVPFAFSTNGHEYLFHDATAPNGLVETTIPPEEFPTPSELWKRYCAWKGLAGQAETTAQEEYYGEDERKALRYYQAVAVNRVVQAVGSGQRRILLVMATGTGKTLTAFQIMWRLRRSGRAKRILFLVDRNILADQALVNDFRGFGPVMTKVSHGNVDKSYEVYLALYQAVTGPDREIYRQFTPDFFDLIVIDECHRGSAATDSAWRAVLDYFESAVHVGLTATPKETSTVSNTEYFGAPVYTYSLKNGIDDGFLAPFRVRRVELDKDLGGWRPSAGQRDRYSEEIPDRIYTSRDYDRSLILSERTKAVASALTSFMKTTDRFAKTIVFCEDIEHAERMRQELVNVNADLIADHQKYIVRITGDSQYGAADLDAFIDPASMYPVIVTTSKLLSTGVDAQTCKIIALDQSIQSMTEFKQIIGRGTRIREDYGKRWFTIFDFRRATQLFADPAFDGEPDMIKDDDEALDPEPEDSPSGDGTENDEPEAGEKRPKYYVDGVPVTVLQERVQYFDHEGRLITESLRDYARSRILGEYQSLDSFLQHWSGSERKSAVIEVIEERGVPIDALEDEIGREYDPFDLICHVVFDRPPLTRSQRAARVRATDYFTRYGDIAQAVLRALLDKYAAEGPSGIEDAQILRIRPISDIGTPVEIFRSFGGRVEYDAAVRDLSSLLYESAGESA